MRHLCLYPYREPEGDTITTPPFFLYVKKAAYVLAHCPVLLLALLPFVLSSMSYLELAAQNLQRGIVHVCVQTCVHVGSAPCPEARYRYFN